MIGIYEMRISELEEALCLFAAILTGEPSEATAQEKAVAIARFAQLMGCIRDRVVSR